MESAALRLKALRNSTEPKISSRALAEMLNVPASTYAAYEDPKKFKKPIIPFNLAKDLATIFERYGVPKHRTMELAGVTGEIATASAGEQTEDEWVEVTGAVAAGRWLEQTDWPESEQYDVKFGPPPFRGAKRFGVRMEGQSMNRTIKDGSDLECLWIKFSNIEPRPGDLVIVERKAHDLTEMTCKRLDRDEQGWLLRAESFDPQFDDPIRIGEPSPDTVTDEGIRVVGVVLTAKLDLAPAGLSQRRYKNRT